MGGTSSIFNWMNSEAWNEFVWRKNNKDWESQLFLPSIWKKIYPPKALIIPIKESVQVRIYHR